MGGKTVSSMDGGGILEGATPLVLGRAVRSPMVSFGGLDLGDCFDVSERADKDDGCWVSKSSQASSFETVDTWRGTAVGRFVGRLEIVLGFLEEVDEAAFGPEFLVDSNVSSSPSKSPSKGKFSSKTSPAAMYLTKKTLGLPCYDKSESHFVLILH